MNEVPHENVLGRGRAWAKTSGMKALWDLDKPDMRPLG